MKHFPSLLCLLAGTFSWQNAQAQVGTVRGTISEALLQAPVANAIVRVEASPLQALSDSLGRFELGKLPPGRYTFRAEHPAYETVYLTEVLVISGKETVLDIRMEAKITGLDNVTVRARKSDRSLNNDMAGISSRSMTVEQTQRYAAAVNDPARMVTSFAGVVGADDGNNKIIIRGNAPNGLLWRMEGIDIPNPNHFSNVGTSGGGISILSAQVLSGADFMTGAFSPEYGNALSGVFDLHLRKGNSTKKEFTFQAGVLGLDMAAEGPMGKKQASSFLVNYRYSTLGILGQLGVQVGPGVTTFQDLSWNLQHKLAKGGQISFFGFGGLSSQHYVAQPDSTRWQSQWDRYGSRFNNRTFAAGLTHNHALNRQISMKQVLLLSGTGQSENTTETDLEMQVQPLFRFADYSTRLSYRITFTQKIRLRHSLRYGMMLSSIQRHSEQEQTDSQRRMQQVLDARYSTGLMQGFVQWRWRINDALRTDIGLHSISEPAYGQHRLEPRAALRWELTRRLAFSGGYGLHSQTLPAGIREMLFTSSNGATLNPNRQLRMPGSHHYIVAVNYRLRAFMRMRLEAYCQQLFDIPLELGATSSWSFINQGEGYPYVPMRSGGRGNNRGIEATIEKDLHRGWYFLLTASAYRSRYAGSDGITRPTRWDGGYTSVLTAGREWTLNSEGRKRILALNVKSVYTGGLRETPIDLAASIQQNETVWTESEAFSLQLPAYFRTDFKFSLRSLHAKRTQTWSLDIQNISNRQNIQARFFDPHKKQMVTYYGMGILPVLAWRIDF